MKNNKKQASARYRALAMSDRKLYLMISCILHTQKQLLKRYEVHYQRG
jgi:hypothetical protein